MFFYFGKGSWVHYNFEMDMNGTRKRLINHDLGKTYNYSTVYLPSSDVTAVALQFGKVTVVRH